MERKWIFWSFSLNFFQVNAERLFLLYNYIRLRFILEYCKLNVYYTTIKFQFSILMCSGERSPLFCWHTLKISLCRIIDFDSKTIDILYIKNKIHFYTNNNKKSTIQHLTQLVFLHLLLPQLILFFLFFYELVVVGWSTEI